MNDEKSMELNDQSGIPETAAVAERDNESFCYKCYHAGLRLLNHGAAMERQRNEVKQIARDLCETISYLAPDLLDRHGYTFEKAAVMRCLEMLNEDPEANFREATKKEDAK